jgi:hypothetical protein
MRNTSRSNELRLMQMLAMESGAVRLRNRLRLKTSQAVLRPCQAHAATRVANLTKLLHCRRLANPNPPEIRQLISAQSAWHDEC